MIRTNTTRQFAKPAFLALSCVGAFASQPALASDGPEPGPTADDDGQDRRDVIVEGRRTKQEASPKDVAPVVDTPKSVVVIPRTIIQDTGSNTLQDALRTVPGITFGAAEGGNPIGDRPFIRGFDSQGSIYVDGVRDLSSQTRETFAIDSIQIVRGSDSTLGGRGAAGGTINIISKLPQAGSFGSISASAGNADYKRISGDVNLALSPTMAFRVQGLWHDQDIAGRDAVYSRRWGVAPSFAIGIGTPTRLTASYYYLESHELPDSGLPFLYTIGNAPGTGDIYTTGAIGDVTLANGQTGHIDRDTFYGLRSRDFRDATVHQATLRAEHDFGGVTLRNTARFTHSDQAYIYTQPDDSQGNVYGTTATNTGANLTSGGYVWRRANTRYGYSEALGDQLDLYGTLDTGGIKHSFAIGVEVSWEKARRGTYVLATGSTISPRCNTTTVARYYCTSLFTPNPGDPWVNYTSDTSTVQTPIVKGAANTETQNDAETQSAYAFDSITLTPALILNLGARVDRFKSTLTPAFTAGTAAFTLSRTDTLFNWQAGLVFKPMPQTSLYASYATSATPPNALLGEGSEGNAIPTTNTAANLALLDSLEVTKTKSYEIGAKGSFFVDKLAVGLAGFETKIDNARVTDANNNVAFIGRTRIRGVEFTVNGQILPHWTVFGGYTFIDAKIVDGGFTSLAVAANGAAPATSVRVVSVNTGKQVPQTARHSISLWSSIDVTPRFTIGGGAFYQDRRFGGYSDNRTATQTTAGVVTVNPATKVLYRYGPSYWRVDARAAYRLSRNVQLSVNAQNLTDKVYFNQVYTTHYVSIAPGRTVFGTLDVKF